jgi:hypothetical protein
LKDFTVKRDTISLAALQNIQQFGSFRGKVFFRINPAVNGEPALRRHDVEVCNMPRLAKHAHAQGKRATICITHHAAGWFRQEHSDAVLA